MAKSKTPETKNTFQVVAEYIQALLGAVILAILIRGFVFEPFKIPSESMVPTLLVGDHIFVARYEYGLRVPFTEIWLKEFEDPKRGDVVVFNFPEDDDVDFIKRVVGVPGDRIAMKAGQLYVNDVPTEIKPFAIAKSNDVNRCVMDLTAESDAFFPKEFLKFPHYLKHAKFAQKVETFSNGQVHMIQNLRDRIDDDRGADFEVIVPPRNFFVMGDNRDQSHDSRFWGFVPREKLKGKAKYIWLSLNHERTACSYNFIPPEIFPNIRWDRFGRKIY